MCRWRLRFPVISVPIAIFNIDLPPRIAHSDPRRRLEIHGTCAAEPAVFDVRCRTLPAILSTYRHRRASWGLADRNGPGNLDPSSAR